MLISVKTVSLIYIIRLINKSFDIAHLLKHLFVRCGTYFTVLVAVFSRPYLSIGRAVGMSCRPNFK